MEKVKTKTKSKQEPLKSKGGKSVTNKKKLTDNEMICKFLTDAQSLFKKRASKRLEELRVGVESLKKIDISKKDDNFLMNDKDVSPVVESILFGKKPQLSTTWKELQFCNDRGIKMMPEILKDKNMTELEMENEFSKQFHKVYATYDIANKKASTEVIRFKQATRTKLQKIFEKRMSTRIDLIMVEIEACVLSNLQGTLQLFKSAKADQNKAFKKVTKFRATIKKLENEKEKELKLVKQSQKELDKAVKDEDLRNEEKSALKVQHHSNSVKRCEEKIRNSEEDFRQSCMGGTDAIGIAFYAFHKDVHLSFIEQELYNAHIAWKMAEKITFEDAMLGFAKFCDFFIARASEFNLDRSCTKEIKAIHTRCEQLGYIAKI